MTDQIAYQEYIQRRYNAFCKTVIRCAALDKILKLKRQWERQVSLDYLMNEKFVQFAAAERSRVEALEEEVARLRAQVGGASVGAQTPQSAEAQADIKTAEAQTDGGQTAETAPAEESADKEITAEPPVGNGEQANAAEPSSEAPADEDTESGN